MSFWDDIYKLREQGLIPPVWTRADIRPHLLGAYTPNTIGTVPSNASMTRDGKQIGNYVKHGRDAQAWRVGPDKFQLVTDPADDPATQEGERRRAKAYAHLARRIAAGDPYPLRGLPFKYYRPFDPVDLYDEERLE